MTKRLATVLVMCANCGRPAANNVICAKTWFTLFFIPIFPFSVKYRMVCTFCGGVTQIDKATAQQYAAQAQVQQQQPGPGQPQPGQPQPGSRPHPNTRRRAGTSRRRKPSPPTPHRPAVVRATAGTRRPLLGQIPPTPATRRPPLAQIPPLAATHLPRRPPTARPGGTPPSPRRRPRQSSRHLRLRPLHPCSPSPARRSLRRPEQPSAA